MILYNAKTNLIRYNVVQFLISTKYTFNNTLVNQILFKIQASDNEPMTKNNLSIYSIYT